jgi:hypothetical protein
MEYFAVAWLNQSLYVAFLLVTGWFADGHRLLLDHHTDEFCLIRACHQGYVETSIVKLHLLRPFTPFLRWLLLRWYRFLRRFFTFWLENLNLPCRYLSKLLIVNFVVLIDHQFLDFTCPFGPVKKCYFWDRNSRRKHQALDPRSLHFNVTQAFMAVDVELYFAVLNLETIVVEVLSVKHWHSDHLFEIGLFL